MNAPRGGDRTKVRRGDAVRKRPAAAKPRRPAPRKPSYFSLLIARFPDQADQLRAASRYIFFGAVACLLGAGAFAAQLPQMLGIEMGEAIGHAGFQVKRVEIIGIKRMERLPVYAVALDQQSMAMPLLDLEQVRNELMQFGWVKDARVSRRLPDTLVVDIVERQPVAVWQHHQQLTLVDGEGVLLAPVDLANMPDLPLVIGPDANRQVQDMQALLDAVPSVKPLLAGAIWVGGRRWDLRFHSGEELALPEGSEQAQHALVKFVRIDAHARMLGKGFARFDMRIPDRLVVRKVEQKEPEVAPPPPSVTKETT
jgi:cell division protein FtsQ